MKRKTIANIVMITIIAVILAAGILGVGHIQGWFDKDDGTQAILCDIRGVVRLEREGVSYKVEGETVLRAGDNITCDPGATASIRAGKSTFTVGEKAVLTVTEPSVDTFAAELASGEVFADCVSPSTLTIGSRQIALDQSTVHISVRSDAQSVSVLRGTVEGASSGQMLNCINDDLSVSALDINSLNDFAIAQMRSVGDRYTLCFTQSDLDRLEADRLAAIQDQINDQTIPTGPETDTNQPPRDPTLPSGGTEDKEDNEDRQQIQHPSTGTTQPTGPDTGNPDPAVPSDPDSSVDTEPSDTPHPTEATQPAETTQPTEAPKPEAKKGTCTITIRCDTILNNMSDLNPGKAGFVPGNGVILSSVSVTFTEGETVFDVLKRVCEKTGIQLEYSWQPMFDTYYIESINNLYEKDCGSESGWMYKVNGRFPNYGVSTYPLEDGDTIAFLYSCKGYGTDVGAPEWEG